MPHHPCQGGRDSGEDPSGCRHHAQAQLPLYQSPPVQIPAPFVAGDAQEGLPNISVGIPSREEAAEITDGFEDCGCQARHVQARFY